MQTSSIPAEFCCLYFSEVLGLSCVEYGPLNFPVTFAAAQRTKLGKKVIYATLCVFVNISGIDKEEPYCPLVATKSG